MIKNQSPRHAHYELGQNENTGEKNVILDNKKIGTIHTVSDPKAEFDIVIEDNLGNEKLRKKVSNPTGRWGERIDLELTDNYQTIRVENVKNTKRIDIFLE